MSGWANIERVPEGHTIHRKVVDQSPLMAGRHLAVSSPNRRFESGAAILDGRLLERIDAWGKHLFYFFEGRRVLHVHLGMDGRFRHHRGPVTGAGPPGRGTWLRASAPALTFDLGSPRVCEVIDEQRQRAIVARLGPDPIRGDDGMAALAPIRASGLPIGAALMDQSLVAGIGNIYRAEILYACAIHPGRPAGTLSREEWAGIWSTAARLMTAGVRDRGEIHTVDRRDLRVRDGRRVHVYGQRLCARCGSPVRSWDLAGRVAYACETCQPRWPASVT